MPKLKLVTTKFCALSNVKKLKAGSKNVGITFGLWKDNLKLKFGYKICLKYYYYCFAHPIFGFWFLVTFGDEVTKILHNLCLHFARQDRQDRQDGKNRKGNHASKVTKIQKPKDENMG